MAGCSDPDKNSGAGSPTDPLTPPTVTSVTPLDGSTLVCPNTVLITATFSKAMNPATITTTTFTLTGASAASVSGQVTYNSATNVATFTPSASLAPNTTFTATITTGVVDTFGNPLAANKVWTFMTTAPCAPPAGALALGASCSFGILGATPVVSSIGPTIVTGDIGIWPALSVTGFPPGTLTGVEHLGDPVAMTAQGDLTTAYNNAAGEAGGAVLTADIGGQTLAPGVYKTTSAQPTLGITGNLTLNGNGVYIFQIVSSLTTAAGPGQKQSNPGWRRRVPRRVLAGRKFGNAWVRLHIPRNHTGSGFHHAWNGRDVEWQGAGADGCGLVRQQSGQCTSLSMRYSRSRRCRSARSTTVRAGKARFHGIEVRRNIRMSSQSKSHPWPSLSRSCRQ